MWQVWVWTCIIELALGRPSKLHIMFVDWNWTGKSVAWRGKRHQEVFMTAFSQRSTAVIALSSIRMLQDCLPTTATLASMSPLTCAESFHQLISHYRLVMDKVLNRCSSSFVCTYIYIYIKINIYIICRWFYQAVMFGDWLTGYIILFAAGFIEHLCLVCLANQRIKNSV